MSTSGRTIYPTDLYVVPPTGVAATDTANIQNALNLSTSSTPKTIILGQGNYQINAALSMPFAPGTAVVGQGREVTTITQNTAGVPIFSFTHDLTHTITVRDLTATYNVAQTVAGSAAFYYHVAGGTGNGFFHHLYENLYVKNAYYGFYLQEGDGSQPLWDVLWRDVDFYTIAASACRFNGGIGMPELDFIHCGVFSTPTVTQTGDIAAFTFNACGVQMVGIAVEQWNDQAFYNEGGGSLDIKNLHVESHNFTQASSTLVKNNPSTTLQVDGFSIGASATAGNTSSLVLFGPGGSNGPVTVKNGTHNVTTTLSTANVLEVIWSGAGVANQAVRFENIIKTGGGLNQPLTGTRGAQVAEYSPFQTPRQYRITTIAYSQQQFDGVIVVNAASAVQVTLLDPTACMVGVPVTVKNVTANTVTIASAGVSKTIDGAASTTLAQWAKASFISDGTQWLSV